MTWEDAVQQCRERLEVLEGNAAGCVGACHEQIRCEQAGLRFALRLFEQALADQQVEPTDTQRLDALESYYYDTGSIDYVSLETLRAKADKLLEEKP